MRRVYDSITYLNRILLVTARRRPCSCLSQKGIWHGFQPHAPVRGARPAISGQAFARRARARLSRDRRPLRRAASQRAVVALRAMRRALLLGPLSAAKPHPRLVPPDRRWTAAGSL